jgi:hypothetical protein
VGCQAAGMLVKLLIREAAIPCANCLHMRNLCCIFFDEFVNPLLNARKGLRIPFVKLPPVAFAQELEAADRETGGRQNIRQDFGDGARHVFDLLGWDKGVAVLQKYAESRFEKLDQQSYLTLNQL